MAVADAAGIPLAIHVASASPHEVTLVAATLDRGFTNESPKRLIGYKAYDSAKLDAKLKEDWGNDCPKSEEAQQNPRWPSFATVPPPLEA